MAQKKKREAIKPQQREKVCLFCRDKNLPIWQEYESLKHFLSPRGRILGREVTSVCVKHQRALASAVKQARHLALLPFTTLEE